MVSIKTVSYEDLFMKYSNCRDYFGIYANLFDMYIKYKEYFDFYNLFNKNYICHLNNLHKICVIYFAPK